MEYHLPQGRNLLEQIYLKGGGPLTATRTEPVKGVVVGDCGGEVAVENHRQRLLDHLRRAYGALVPSHFRDQDHRLPGRLLHKDSVSEC